MISSLHWTLGWGKFYCHIYVCVLHFNMRSSELKWGWNWLINTAYHPYHFGAFNCVDSFFNVHLDIFSLEIWNSGRRRWSANERRTKTENRYCSCYHSESQNHAVGWSHLCFGYWEWSCCTVCPWEGVSWWVHTYLLISSTNRNRCSRPFDLFDPYTGRLESHYKHFLDLLDYFKVVRQSLSLIDYRQSTTRIKSLVFTKAGWWNKVVTMNCCRLRMVYIKTWFTCRVLVWIQVSNPLYLYLLFTLMPLAFTIVQLDSWEKRWVPG